MNIFSLTAKKVVDVSTFIKENASAGKLRYTTEAGTTHRIYFPVRDDGNGNFIPYIQAVPVHGWGGGSSFNSHACIKGVTTDDGLYTGVCPVCDRLTDASDIVKYIKAEKEAECTLTGEARKKYFDELDRELWKSRKVSPARLKYYVALVLLKCDKEGRALIEGDGPPFTIHIAAWQESFVKKLLDALEMQDEDPNLGGHEFKLKYGDYSDAMTRVGQCAVSYVTADKMLVKHGTPLSAMIAKELETFDFEHTVEIARPEAQGRSPSELTAEMNVLFREWDNYKARVAVDPDAKYLEYANAAAIIAGKDNVSGSTPAPGAGTTSAEVDMAELDEALFGGGS